MGLLAYQKQFSNLRLNNSGGRRSPHKVAMLSAVIDLIAGEQITENRIYFDAELVDAFTQKFQLFASERDQNRPYLPFFHLKGEPFWHLVPIPGAESELAGISTVAGPGVVRKTIAYASLDDELFELLQSDVCRAVLSESLRENLVLGDIQQKIEVNGWDWLECEVLVADYFDMLSKELRGERYSKTEHRLAVMSKLPKRNKGSIEFKHQNVSAILVELGQPYLAGYKPRFNYQLQLSQVVRTYLTARGGDVEQVFDRLADLAPESQVVEWQSVLDPKIPERLNAIQEAARQYVARKQNFIDRESRNRKLGERGEAFVLEYEKWRLADRLRSDLAARVRWSSKLDGDGLGYDILTFDYESGVERFIEVKTTNSAKYSDFYISANELAFSRNRYEQYALYRVFNFSSAPRFFTLEGRVDQYVNLQPISFRAGFG